MVIYPSLRLLYVDMAHVTLLYGDDETEFSKKLNFVKPQLIAFARASHARSESFSQLS